MKLKKDTPFLGREALLEQQAKPLPRLLAGFTADPDVVLLGRETIYRDGERVGWLSSGGYGYTVGRSIGYGYVRDPDGVDRDYVLAGRTSSRSRASGCRRSRSSSRSMIPKDRRSEPEIVATVSRSANDADTGPTHGLAQIPHVSVPLTSSAAGPI